MSPVYLFFSERAVPSSLVNSAKMLDRDMMPKGDAPFLLTMSKSPSSHDAQIYLEEDRLHRGMY